MSRAELNPRKQPKYKRGDSVKVTKYATYLKFGLVFTIKYMRWYPSGKTWIYYPRMPARGIYERNISPFTIMSWKSIIQGQSHAHSSIRIKG